MMRKIKHFGFFTKHFPKYAILFVLLFHFSVSDFGFSFSNHSIEAFKDTASENEKDSNENELFLSLTEKQSRDSKHSQFMDANSKLTSVKHFSKITSPPPESF